MKTRKFQFTVELGPYEFGGPWTEKDIQAEVRRVCRELESAICRDALNSKTSKFVTATAQEIGGDE